MASGEIHNIARFRFSCLIVCLADDFVVDAVSIRRGTSMQRLFLDLFVA